MIAAQTAANPGNPAVAQFILSVASGLTVVVLGYIANMLRRFMREHEYLMTTTKQHSEAIESLLKERRPGRRH